MFGLASHLIVNNSSQKTTIGVKRKATKEGNEKKSKSKRTGLSGFNLFLREQAGDVTRQLAARPAAAVKTAGENMRVTSAMWKSLTKDEQLDFNLRAKQLSIAAYASSSSATQPAKPEDVAPSKPSHSLKTSSVTTSVNKTSSDDSSSDENDNDLEDNGHDDDEDTSTSKHADKKQKKR